MAITEERDRQIVEMYKSGRSLREVRAELGISHSTVKRTLIRLGIPLRPPSRPKGRTGRSRDEIGFTPSERREMCRRYQAGDSLSIIADAYGSTPSTVKKHVVAGGVKLRPRGNELRVLEPHMVEQLLAEWDAGKALWSIANSLGISAPVGKRILAEHGREFERRLRSGEDHHLFKGRVKHAEGYVACYVPTDHEFAAMRNSSQYVLEHRLVMAVSLGRPLRSDETVHHINGVRDDNRLENLQLRSGRHGRGMSARCHECGSTNIEFTKIAGS